MARKRALLISSPFAGLRGPTNDVQKMKRTLMDIGFEDMQLCTELDATRTGILQGFHALADVTRLDDVVVVYYSGHGGVAECAANRVDLDQDPRASDTPGPWRYQFLVPVDFQPADSGDFRGILDIELSGLLERLTDKTKNVTVILDCCYAGQMARDPSSGDDAVPKSISNWRHQDILDYVQRLREDRESILQPDPFVGENPFTVRVAAAAAAETAWEYRDISGEWCGAMTEALTRVLSESKGVPITWKTTMLRVSELVNARFPSQHPRVEGPMNRFRFSLQQRATEGIPVQNEDGNVVLQAGYVSRVREGNIYSVMPLESEKAAVQRQIAEARVRSATAFKAIVDLSFDASHASSSLRLENGAMAFLKRDALEKWPVAIPGGCRWLAEMVEKSKFVRPRTSDHDSLILAVIHREKSGRLSLRNSRGIEVATLKEARTSDTDATPDEQAKFFESVERLARARHLLALTNETPKDILRHNMEIGLGLVDNNKARGRVIRQDGTDSIDEGDRIYIRIANRGINTVHVWIFDVNAGGCISRISRSNGIDLSPGQDETVGASRHGPGLVGLRVS